MPTFSSTPPQRGSDFALTLVRIPAGPGRSGIITSSNLVGCYTHWWGGRTQPCEDEHCQACKEGMPRRWHAYVSAWSNTPSFHYLMELTLNATPALIEYHTAWGTLRGGRYQARRSTHARNSRLTLSVAPADLNGIALPREPNIVACLAIIWSLPETAIKINGAAAPEQHLAIDQAAAFAAATAASITGRAEPGNQSRKRLTLHDPGD